MRIKRENLKPLGDGGEKRVYENPNNPEQALGLFHRSKAESVEEVKGRFYLTKILHMLLPKNIPDMHLAASHPNAIIVDKVENMNKTVTSEHRDTHDLIELSDKLKEAGIKNLDDNWFNFKFNKDGDINYVDSFRPWFKFINPDDSIELRVEFDREKLEAGIQNLDDDKKELAMSYLKRLDEIYEKEVENFKKLSEK